MAVSAETKATISSTSESRTRRKKDLMRNQIIAAGEEPVRIDPSIGLIHGSVESMDRLSWGFAAASGFLHFR
jgi:hypothetical protein